MTFTAAIDASLPTTDPGPSTGDLLVALGQEINAHQYRLVHLAARYDDELEWFHAGHKSAAGWISAQLGVHAATAREWIRVGHALDELAAIDAAFARNELSYAKVRILTRWAEAHNEDQLLGLAQERSADRLTTAIAQALAADGETDEERDARLHDTRALTTWTDGDGMTIIRVAVPPSTGKPILAAVDDLVRRIAHTPAPEPSGGHDEPTNDPTVGDDDAPADSFVRPSVVNTATHGARNASADSFVRPSVTDTDGDLAKTLVELRRHWQPAETDDWAIPSLAQQRADAFTALFLGLDIDLTTEIVIHVRGDGTTFDDGTPTTNHAVLRHLDHAFLRAMIHNANRRPLNTSHRRRHPTTTQKRLAMEAHGHECVDCQTTDLLELDHNPPYHQTQHTTTNELEPRCAPCHRARHRHHHPPQRRVA